jgi:L-amino acid N-acyltransferase YncA
VFAVVGDDNAASQALFRTLGFEATDRRPSEPQARHCRIFRRRLAGAK